MKIVFKKYAVTNPRWKGPNERVKIVSKEFCCENMEKLNEHLSFPNQLPLVARFVHEDDECDYRISYGVNFCPGCGAKIEFVESA